MPSLINDIFGLGEKSTGSRPQALESNGINLLSEQAVNLVAAFPLWGPPYNKTQGVHNAMSIPLDYGISSLRARATNILITHDPQFGAVFTGDGSVRPYTIPYNAILDFGITPSSFSVSFWLKTPAAYNPAATQLICEQDSAGGIGYYVGVQTDGAGKGSIFTGTGNSGAVDSRCLIDSIHIDGNWHHYLFCHQVGTAASADAITFGYADGNLVSVATAQNTVGPSGGVGLAIGTDSDGVSSPLGAAGNLIYLCDLRFYKSLLPGGFASKMWHPDTRWNLWQPTSKRWFFNPNASGPPPTAVTQILKGGILNSPLVSSGGICS